MGLAQMGLAIKTKLMIFVRKWIRPKLDAYKGQVAHSLHGPTPRYPKHFPKPLGPWATKIKGLWQTHVFSTT